MMSCHLISTWHEWNANAVDVMVTWFAHDAKLGSDIMLGMRVMRARAWRTCYN